MTPEITVLLNNTDELTVFLPRDDAWDSLDKLERLYLESEYATDDLLRCEVVRHGWNGLAANGAYRILNMHAVVQDGVKWSDSFEPATNRAFQACTSCYMLTMRQSPPSTGPRSKSSSHPRRRWLAPRNLSTLTSTLQMVSRT